MHTNEQAALLAVATGKVVHVIADSLPAPQVEVANA